MYHGATRLRSGGSQKLYSNPAQPDNSQGFQTRWDKINKEIVSGVFTLSHTGDSFRFWEWCDRRHNVTKTGKPHMTFYSVYSEWADMRMREGLCICDSGATECVTSRNLLAVSTMSDLILPRFCRVQPTCGVQLHITERVRDFPSRNSLPKCYQSITRLPAVIPQKMSRGVQMHL
jgi:hypothetical protein